MEVLIIIVFVYQYKKTVRETDTFSRRFLGPKFVKIGQADDAE